MLTKFPWNFIFFDLVFEIKRRAPKSSFFSSKKSKKDKFDFFFTFFCWYNKAAFWTFFPKYEKKDKFVFWINPCFSGIRRALYKNKNTFWQKHFFFEMKSTFRVQWTQKKNHFCKIVFCMIWPEWRLSRDALSCCGGYKCPVLLCLVVSCLGLPCLVLCVVSCLVSSFPVLSCLILLCLVLYCLVLHCLVS